MKRATLALLAWVALGAACGNSESPGKTQGDAGLDGGSPMPELSREDLLNPETCKTCHPRHYREWSSSMHAYAAKDPVFLAMNQRGQRETKGKLGDFCINCHAPMAVREGKTKDGLNLADVPESLQGVTCYFCHNAVGVKGHDNGKLELANDTTMRAAIKDAVFPGAHKVAYSEAHDRNDLKSSELCGSCHDVVTPSGVHLERTYAEYQKSLFVKPGAGRFDTCVGCHMDPAPEKGKVATVEGLNLPDRTLHEHLWPGVDVALTDFPYKKAQQLAVECALMSGTQLLELSADDVGNTFTIILETNAGHNQPSGTAQDRRLWLEFVAYDAQDKVIFQSGKIADQDLEEYPEGDPKYDPYLTLFRDRIYDAAGKEAHMFWETASSSQYPTGYKSNVLPYTIDANTPHSVTLKYVLQVLPARVEVRLRIRPVGMDLLNNLVDSGDLDPKLLDSMPTFTLHGTEVEWTQADGTNPITSPKPPPVNCPDDYLKLLE